MADKFDRAQLAIVQEDVGLVVDVRSYASRATASGSDKAAATVHVEWACAWKFFQRASASISKVNYRRNERIIHNGNDGAILADVGDLCPIQAPGEILRDP